MPFSLSFFNSYYHGTKHSAIEAARIVETLIPSRLTSRPTQTRKSHTKETLTTRASSQVRPSKVLLARSDLKDLAEAFHYLITTDDTKCVETTRVFLAKHEHLVAVFAHLKDSKVRK